MIITSSLAHKTTTIVNLYYCSVICLLVIIMVNMLHTSAKCCNRHISKINKHLEVRGNFQTQSCDHHIQQENTIQPSVWWKNGEYVGGGWGRDWLKWKLLNKLFWMLKMKQCYRNECMSRAKLWLFFKRMVCEYVMIIIA